MRRNVIEGIREAFLADWVVIRYGPNEVFRLAPERLERVTSARVGKNAWTLLKSMKKGEHSLCSVKDEEFRRNEDP
jgi:hypothetical protein